MRLRHRDSRRGVRLPASLPAASNQRRDFEKQLELSLRTAAHREPYLHKVELAYDDVPGSDPAEWEDPEPPLCRAFKRNRLRAERDRIVFYRLPLQRAHPTTAALRHAIITLAIAQARALRDTDSKKSG